jgi:hypothetical protein
MRKTYGLEMIGLHRNGETLREGEDIRNMPFQAGDTLVVHTPWDVLPRIEKDKNFVVVTTEYPREESRPQKVGWTALFFCIALSMVLFTDIRLSVALLTGAIGMVLSGVLNVEEAYDAVSWKTVFLLVAMTYINAMEERRVFDALRGWLIARGFGFRSLFWITGALAFFISPVADNLTTALLMCAVVLSVGGNNSRFVTLACINIVVGANAGGAFSPFGDITTLMVWQKGFVEFWTFFALFLPAALNFLVPAIIMSFAIPGEHPVGGGEKIMLMMTLTAGVGGSLLSIG